MLNFIKEKVYLLLRLEFKFVLHTVYRNHNGIQRYKEYKYKISSKRQYLVVYRVTKVAIELSSWDSLSCRLSGRWPHVKYDLPPPLFYIANSYTMYGQF